MWRLFLVVLLVGPQTGSDTKPPAAPLRPGMIPAEVRAALGPPRHISRQILYLRYQEQWHYDRPDVAWVEFECRKGQEPRLQTVHPSRPANP